MRENLAKCRADIMDTQHIKIAIEGMTCASCVGRVESTLADVNGVSDASVNLASESAQFEITEGADLGQVAAALEGMSSPLLLGH